MLIYSMTFLNPQSILILNTGYAVILAQGGEHGNMQVYQCAVHKKLSLNIKFYKRLVLFLTFTTEM